MEKRSLGNTGLMVSVVGLGTVKFGRNLGVKYPKAFDLPTDETCADILAVARDCGINLIDTAPAYGTSEARLGQCLKGQRHDWIISTKVGEAFENGESFFNFSAKAIVQSVENSLKRLGTDYLDVVLVHSNGDDVRLIDEGVFEPLIRLKTAGKIRAFGMSTKTIEGGKLAVKHADVVMVSFNPQYMDEREVIAFAHQQHKGVLIKKAFGSGHHITDENSPASTLKLILTEPGVSSVIVGTLNANHLRQNTNL